MIKNLSKKITYCGIDFFIKRSSKELVYSWNLVYNKKTYSGVIGPVLIPLNDNNIISLAKSIINNLKK